jgi:hypothetical protein
VIRSGQPRPQTLVVQAWLFPTSSLRCASRPRRSEALFSSAAVAVASVEKKAIRFWVPPSAAPSDQTGGWRVGMASII